MKVFRAFQRVDNMKPCMSKKVVIHAKQVDELFKIRLLDGTFLRGKVGDYVVQDVDNRLFVCDEKTFEQTYYFIDPAYNYPKPIKLEPSNYDEAK